MICAASSAGWDLPGWGGILKVMPENPQSLVQHGGPRRVDVEVWRKEMGAQLEKRNVADGSAQLFSSYLPSR